MRQFGPATTVANVLNFRRTGAMEIPLQIARSQLAATKPSHETIAQKP